MSDMHILLYGPVKTLANKISALAHGFMQAAPARPTTNSTHLFEKTLEHYRSIYPTALSTADNKLIAKEYVLHVDAIFATPQYQVTIVTNDLNRTYLLNCFPTFTLFFLLTENINLRNVLAREILTYGDIFVERVYQEVRQHLQSTTTQETLPSFSTYSAFATCQLGELLAKAYPKTEVR